MENENPQGDVLDLDITGIDTPDVPAPAAPVVTPPAPQPATQIDRNRLQKTAEFLAANPEALQEALKMVTEKTGQPDPMLEILKRDVKDEFGLAREDMRLLTGRNETELREQAAYIASIKAKPTPAPTAAAPASQTGANTTAQAMAPAAQLPRPVAAMSAQRDVKSIEADILNAQQLV